jgi:hypothetical protein
MKRATFIETMFAVTAGWYITGCYSKSQPYSPIIVNSNAALGHMLLQKNENIKIEHQSKTDVFIIGGGVAGLSAARWINKNSNLNITIADLAHKMGGNALGGANKITKYPWAAHYLPLPNLTNKRLLQFLEEANIIINYNGNLPVYNEEYLCNDPKERIFFKGQWQNGLILNSGISDIERKELHQFHVYVESLKNKIDSNNKFIFDIPLKNSSTEKVWIALDEISFYDWLLQHNYKSKPLHWYLNYCCKDDYGATTKQVSAWAGLHYFCSRRAEGVNVKSSDILTWPEGNEFLVEKLLSNINARCLNNELVVKAEFKNDIWLITHYNAINKKYSLTEAKHIICNAPLRIAKILFPNVIQADLFAKTLHNPWLIGNIILNKKFTKDIKEQICWDNVIYGANGLGYVNATHQYLSEKQNSSITYYLPIVHEDAKQKRKELNNSNGKELEKLILDELVQAHPNIYNCIEHMEIKVLGHGMIAPVPGYIFNSKRKMLANYQTNNLHFAHTDIVGISIFEEGFEIGIDVAEKIVNV